MNERPNRTSESIKVSFGEAVGTFFDLHGLDLFDEEHSTSKEERFIRHGSSRFGRILWAVYTELKESTRLITARKAETFGKK